MQYLKKKKMFEIVQQIADLDCEVKLKNCEYWLYRGTEQLLLHDNSYIYELRARNGGSFLILKKYVRADSIWERKEVFRHVYNGYGKMEIAVC